MATFRDRFPSARDTARVFASCVVPIYSWSILVFLSRVRGWLYHMPAWDVAGVLAYSLVFAALESGAILFVLLILSAILPRRTMRDKFAARGSVLAVWGLSCAVLVQAILAFPSTQCAQRRPKTYVLGLLALLLVLVVYFVLV